MNPRALVFLLFGLALGEATLINCDFESDFCQWYMKSNGDDSKWQRTRGPTPTNDTGPSHDHTTGDGYYIFLDASHVQEASLYSSFRWPYSVYSTGACLSFWYYMHGEDVHTLELRFERNLYSHDTYFTPIHWSLKGPQGDQWLPHNISIKYHDNSNLQLVFTAKRGYFPRGDIALDDISIDFDAPCEYEERAVTPKEAETTTETPYLITTKVLVKSDTNFVYADSRIELECQFDEEKYRKQLDEGTLKVFWYKRNIDSEYQSTVEWGENPLVFGEISRYNSGFYWCTLQQHYTTRQASNTSEVVEINVVPDPRPSPPLEIAEYNDGIHRGNSIDAVTGVDVETVVKLVCGEEINGGEYHWKTSSHAFNSSNLPKDRILVLNSAQPKHSGVYSCRISKDGFFTAKSNVLELSVRPGKYCTSSYNCYGDEYLRNCLWYQRCECAHGFVPRGKSCWPRAEAPKIKVYPDYSNFDIGDSFYLMCEADEPAPAGLTYTFSRSYNRYDLPNITASVNILKILNAAEGDSGQYSCLVTLDGIDSKYSPEIPITVQDFKLNCDFSIDLCGWSQRNDSVTAKFSTVSPVRENGKQSVGPSGPFLQLHASKTQDPNRAVLISPVINHMGKESCLRFWCRTHGPNLHSISVWNYQYSTDSRRYEGSKLWSDIGDRDKLWVQQNVTVRPGTYFYITIDAVGQVAIDDITFSFRGGCWRY